VSSEQGAGTACTPKSIAAVAASSDSCMGDLMAVAPGGAGRDGGHEDAAALAEQDESVASS